MTKPKLLIVDDDKAILNQMKWALAEEYEIFIAGDSKSALRVFRKERPLLVVLDLGLPPAPRETVEGLKCLDEILALAPETRVLIITGNMEKEAALKAIEKGANDLFLKPIEIAEVKTVLKRALYLYRLERENDELQRKVAGQPFSGMIGKSETMNRIFTSIRKVAATDVPVLITGESGTGKELIARAIHQQSPRRAAPFVVINCGAIPGELLESELFGHEKGAFTGAHILRKGKIEFSEGGTLFLDEIGEMPFALQVKLLRFLENHRLERIGGREDIQVNTRVVAATNSDLKKVIADGRFREDLYYRLSVVTVSVPALRERGSDLDLLANLFLQRYAKEYKKRLKGFHQEAWDAISAYSWPGNVRELENKIQRAVIMSEGRLIKPEDLEFSSPDSQRPVPLRAIREQAERDRILQALARHDGNVSRAATDLEISRPALYELMEKHKIER